MTLQQVKEQVAKKHLYKSWKQLRVDRVISDVILDEVSKEYAKQVAEQGLKDAANNMKVKLNLSLDDYLDIVETPIQLP